MVVSDIYTTTYGLLWRNKEPVNNELTMRKVILRGGVLGCTKLKKKVHMWRKVYWITNRVLKWWRNKNEISEIMGFVRIFWKNNIQEPYLAKMSILGQIVSEMLAGYTQKTPYEPF